MPVIEELKPNVLTRERPPSRWKNRWRMKAAYVRLKCTQCGADEAHLFGVTFLTPHCMIWPTRDVAETMAAQEQPIWYDIVEYVGAEEC